MLLGSCIITTDVHVYTDTKPTKQNKKKHTKLGQKKIPRKEL